FDRYNIGGNISVPVPPPPPTKRDPDRRGNLYSFNATKFKSRTCVSVGDIYKDEKYFMHDICLSLNTHKKKEIHEQSKDNTLTVMDNKMTDPVSKEVRQVVQLLTYVTLCGIISLFGIGANIANIIVFVKQGFKDSINISLLGLAVADLGCVITMFYSSFGYNPVFASMDLPFELQAVTYVSGGYPHIYFNRITSCITVFITFERCLCIAMPLKVKQVITHSRTKAVNVSVFGIMVIVFCPFYFVNKLEWRYDLVKNRTILGITFSKDREI
ncbi:unnamed protein product, partial [Candidula unifasciata]